MRTLVVSDLHLGTRLNIDVARRSAPREALLDEVRGADELILLGDVLELRDGPVLGALNAARPFFEALGTALGEARVVLVPGNHDHRLIEDWRSRRWARAQAPGLGLEQRIAPREASDAAGAIAEWLAPARLELAYPGLWLRGDVYATHGHYLDRHVTIPSFEPLGVRLAERVVAWRGPPPPGADGYETVLAPIYALLHELAQTVPAGRPSGNGISHRAYRIVMPEGDAPRPLRDRLLAALGFPATIAAINRLGLGPMRPDLSGRELRRAALTAMAQVVGRLGIDARYVVFGHTHRPGPLPGDDSSEWRAGAARLVNSGSWVYEAIYLTPRPGDSPYWPGTVVALEDDGPPELKRLLLGRAHDELRPLSGPPRA